MNVVYLVIFLIGGGGITSQSIPQGNMKQCEINAKLFNQNKQLMPNGYSSNTSTNKAYCIIGVR